MMDNGAKPLIKEDKKWYILSFNSQDSRFRKKQRGIESEGYLLIKSLARDDFLEKKWSDLYKDTYPKSYISDPGKAKAKLMTGVIKNVNKKLKKDFGGKVRIEKTKIGEMGDSIDAFQLKWKL